MLPPRVLVTRAAQDAPRWVAALEREGIAAQALALIAIRPLSDPALQAALAQAREHLGDVHALMFVSGNAVRHFFEQNRALALDGKAQAAIKTRCWAPGPGTARALRACGVLDAVIDGPAGDAAQFDSEALWHQVAAQVRPGDRILIVRGTSAPEQLGGQGRNWLAARIEAAGAQADFVASYERAAPAFTEQDRQIALAAASDGTTWLLSSAEALAHLLAWLPDQDWREACALATHPRIALAARAAGFGHVLTCRPTPIDVAASIKSLHEHRGTYIPRP